MTRLAKAACAAAGLLALSGCGDSKKDNAPPVRPVLSIIVSPANDRLIGFAGTIQPQFQTDRGFRVVGRIVTRGVFVGDLVTKDQTLAQLDPLIYQLAVRSSQADLANAQSQSANAIAAEGRTAALFDRKVVSQADIDTAQQTREAAVAAVQKAEANLVKAREQLSYTTLTADFDGVVTTTDAEVGQTVSPGKKVLTLARTDAREAVVDLPEEVAGTLAAGARFDISLQADPAVKTAGKVREIAPQADSATRTRRVKITLDTIVDAFRLGATITAVPVALQTAPVLAVPRSALLERDGVTRVWLVEGGNTVRSAQVSIVSDTGGSVRISSGLPSGSRIVVAGVHSLSEGQSIKIEGAAR